MKFQTPFYCIFGIFFLIAWSIDYFAITKKTILVLKTSGLPLKSSSSFFILKRMFVFFIGAIGIILMSYSTMNPSKNIGFKKQNIFVKDIYFVVDVSLSMLSEDFLPNRLEVAKNKIEEFVALRPTDRIGIVVFSDNAFTLIPLTTDNELVRKSIKDISVGHLGTGTNIGDALALAVGRLKKSKVKNKFIILLTDGVSNSGILTPVEAAKLAKNLKIKIYSVGIGKIKNGKYLKGGSFGYRNIPGGSVDLQTMKNISSSTNGKFFYAGNSTALKNILTEIQKLEKTKIQATQNVLYSSEYYKYLVLGIALFLLAELLRRFILKEAI